MQSLACSELFVLCIISIASKLNLEIQVLKIMMENDVRSCVAKAQSRRLVLSDHVERFLDRHWPGWGSIGESGNPNGQYSQIIVEELAKLCTLGISKEDAEVRLNAQTYKRRTAKLPGVPNTSVLCLRDIRAVIADITGVPLTTYAAPKSKVKKAKGEKDTTYHRPSYYPKTDGPPQLQRLDSDQHPAVLSTNDNEASPRMPDLMSLAMQPPQTAMMRIQLHQGLDNRLARQLPINPLGYHPPSPMTPQLKSKSADLNGYISVIPSPTALVVAL